MEFLEKDNRATIILVGINVIVFVGLTIFGMTENAEYMLSKGAMYAPYVIEYQEYYRLITSMFLHFGIEHLGNNMILLFLVGSQLEKELGSLKYVILYFIAGLGGNILSFVSDVMNFNYAVSAGASGAIFGVIGAILWVAIRNRGQIGTLTSNGLVLMIGLSLYFGFTSTGVDNLAHIGGLVTGFILAIILYRKRNRKLRAFL